MKTKEQYFVQKAFRRFFVPAFLSSVGLALGGLADCYFVGSNLGEQGLACVSFGASIYMLGSLVSIGMSLGGAIHYSNYLSRGEAAEGTNLFYNVLFINFCVQSMFTITGLLWIDGLLAALGVTREAAAYEMIRQFVTRQLMFLPVMFSQAPFYYFVHCDNNPRLAATALVTGNLADILCNYILVGMLKIGASGSVYATVVGALFSISICLVHFLKKKGNLRFCKFKIHIKYITQSIKTGFATSTQYLYQFVTLILTNNLLMRHYGIIAVAAFDIIYNISLLIGAVMESMELTMEPMLSTFAGEKNAANIKYTFKTAIFISMGLSAGLMLCFIAGAESFCEFFGLRSEIGLQYGITGIRIYGLCLIPYVVNCIFSYYCQALGRERIAYILGFSRLFAMYMLFLFLFIDRGFVIFFYTYAASEFATLFILIGIIIKNKDLLSLKDITGAKTFSVFIEPGTSDIGKILQEAEYFYQDKGASSAQIYYMALVIEEICAVIAGATMGTKKEEYIQITITEENGDFTLFLRDNAVQFNPFEKNTDALNIQDAAQGEYAINPEMLSMKIVRNKAKDFFYRRYAGFNTLVIKI